MDNQHQNIPTEQVLSPSIHVRQYVLTDGGIPIWEKFNLTIFEAAEYFGIGINKLRELTNEPGCRYVLRIGSKKLIKRKAFEKFLDSVYVI